MVAGSPETALQGFGQKEVSVAPQPPLPDRSIHLCGNSGHRSAGEVTVRKSPRELGRCSGGPSSPLCRGMEGTTGDD